MNSSHCRICMREMRDDRHIPLCKPCLLTAMAAGKQEAWRRRAEKMDGKETNR